MKCLLYGVFLIFICSWLQFTHSSPTFGEEHVHIKVHLPYEVHEHHHHKSPPVLSHGKVVHHHYHKRRRPGHRQHSAKHIPSSDSSADDLLEALIVATAKKPFHHHHHEYHHGHHREPEDSHVAHHDEQSYVEQEEVSPEDLGYSPLDVHDAYGYQLYNKPVDHSEDLKHYHHAGIEHHLGSIKSHLRPSVYEDSSRLHIAAHANEDFHYKHKPVAEIEDLEIANIYQSELSKNSAQKFELHEHKNPIGTEYVHKIPNVHHIPKEYLPDYLGKVRQVAEYPTVEGKYVIPHHRHPDYEGYEVPSSGEDHVIHTEHSGHEDSSTVAVDGALVDWPAHIVRDADSGHTQAETYDGTDSYSASHVQGVGSGGYHYNPPISRKFKKT